MMKNNKANAACKTIQYFFLPFEENPISKRQFQLFRSTDSAPPVFYFKGKYRKIRKL